MCQTWQGINPEQIAPCIEFNGEQPARADSSGEKVPLAELGALKDELAALRREQSKLYRGIYEAAQVQRRLCAPRQFSSGEFEVAGEIFPVRYLSGDFFKVLDLGSSLGVVVGDIAGKGLSAGIWLPHLVSLMHRCALAFSDPADAVAQANRELCAGYGEPPLVALLFARIDLTDGEILYCNAGLPSPVILGYDRDVTYLDQGGPMLGAMSDAAFRTGKVHLGSGDTLIACSDGVTECQNSQDEEFRLAGLLQAAQAASAIAGRGASQTLFATLGALLDFADGCSLPDDLTLLVVRREANASARERAKDRNSLALNEKQAGGASPVDPARQRLVS
jgi:sigma-B regulation protein RsbU (phosphoserine phosphatase)